jgi:hypothetical protein
MDCHVGQSFALLAMTLKEKINVTKTDEQTVGWASMPNKLFCLRIKQLIA